MKLHTRTKLVLNSETLRNLSVRTARPDRRPIPPPCRPPPPRLPETAMGRSFGACPLFVCTGALPAPVSAAGTCGSGNRC